MTTSLQLLLDASLRITAVALAVWLTLAIANIRSGSVRHAAWVAVLFAMPSVQSLACF